MNKEKFIYELVGRVNNKVKKKTSSEAMEEAKKKGRKLDKYYYQLIFLPILYLFFLNCLKIVP